MNQGVRTRAQTHESNCEKDELTPPSGQDETNPEITDIDAETDTIPKPTDSVTETPKKRLEYSQSAILLDTVKVGSYAPRDMTTYRPTYTAERDLDRPLDDMQMAMNRISIGNIMGNIPAAKTLGRFHGNPDENIVKYLADLDKLFQIYDIPERNRNILMRNCFAEDALRVFDRLVKDEEPSYRHLTSAMRKAFEDVYDPSAARMKLKQAKRRPAESVMSFSARLGKLVEQAYPSINRNDAIDEKVFEMLQDGVVPEFRNWLWQTPKPPTNFAEMQSIIRTFDRMENFRKEQSFDDKVKQSREEINSIQNKDQIIRELREELQKCKSRQNVMQAKFLAKEGARKNSREMPNKFHRQPLNERGVPTCHNCGKPGHFKYACRAQIQRGPRWTNNAKTHQRSTTAAIHQESDREAELRQTIKAQKEEMQARKDQ